MARLMLSPKHFLDESKTEWTLDDKVDVFSARVEDWQLGVAKDMIEKQIKNRGFALLAILISYFEMIAKYYDGYRGERDAAKYFKKGMRMVFPEIDKTVPNTDHFLDSFYRKVRNGLYHIGMIKPGLTVSNEPPSSIAYDEIYQCVVVNPEILATTLQAALTRYVELLKDPSNVALRRNFEKRFDADNALES